MNFHRPWTIFALDAEHDAYGMARIAQAHNTCMSELASARAERDIACTALCPHGLDIAAKYENAKRELAAAKRWHEQSSEQWRVAVGEAVQRAERAEAELAVVRAERKEIWWLPWEPQEVARRFHLAYEHFAPDFGYETRPDTKVFNPYSANGQLMIAVVRNVLIEQASSKGVDELNATRADLAAARALLLEARGWLDPWESRQSALRDRIDAALAGEKK